MFGKSTIKTSLLLASAIGLASCGGGDGKGGTPPETVGASGGSVATSENTTISNGAQDTATASGASGAASPSTRSDAPPSPDAAAGSANSASQDALSDQSRP